MFPFFLLVRDGQNLTASQRLELPLCGAPRILCLHSWVIGTPGISSLWQSLKIFLNWIPLEAHTNDSKLKYAILNYKNSNEQAPFWLRGFPSQSCICSGHNSLPQEGSFWGQSVFSPLTLWSWMREERRGAMSALMVEVSQSQDLKGPFAPVVGKSLQPNQRVV